jgi:hypothetical protein
LGQLSFNDVEDPQQLPLRERNSVGDILVSSAVISEKDRDPNLRVAHNASSTLGSRQSKEFELVNKEHVEDLTEQSDTLQPRSIYPLCALVLSSESQECVLDILDSRCFASSSLQSPKVHRSLEQPRYPMQPSAEGSLDHRAPAALEAALPTKTCRLTPDQTAEAPGKSREDDVEKSRAVAAERLAAIGSTEEALGRREVVSAAASTAATGRLVHIAAAEEALAPREAAASEVATAAYEGATAERAADDALLAAVLAAEAAAERLDAVILSVAAAVTTARAISHSGAANMVRCSPESATSGRGSRNSEMSLCSDDQINSPASFASESPTACTGRPDFVAHGASNAAPPFGSVAYTRLSTDDPQRLSGAKEVSDIMETGAQACVDKLYLCGLPLDQLDQDDIESRCRVESVQVESDLMHDPVAENESDTYRAHCDGGAVLRDIRSSLRFCSRAKMSDSGGSDILAGGFSPLGLRFGRAGGSAAGHRSRLSEGNKETIAPIKKSNKLVSAPARKVCRQSKGVSSWGRIVVEAAEQLQVLAQGAEAADVQRLLAYWR